MEQGEVTILAVGGDDMDIATNSAEMVVVAATADEQYLELQEEKFEEEDGPNAKKLKEGFYEVEAIRKRRVRKGKVQYLIKWKGWPESVNTWEPFEHLEQCQDIVENFEARKTNSGKRKRSGSSASGRKKRPCGDHHMDVQVPYVSGAGSPDSVAAETLLHFPGEVGIVDNPQVVEYPPKVVEYPVAAPTAVESGPDPEDTGSNKELQGVVCKQVDKLRILEQDDASKCEVDTSDATLSMEKAGPSEGNEDQQGGHNCEMMDKTTGKRSSRCTGAKKRKAGAVRRLKQATDSKDKTGAEKDHTSFGEVKKNHPETGIISAVSAEKMQFQEYRTLLFPTSDITKQAFSSPDRIQKSAQKMAPIVKILRPIKYSNSVNNEKQDVLVLFSTLRSDGKESVVDNRYLRQNFPLLLIDFYEQHLRYTVK